MSLQNEPTDLSNEQLRNALTHAFRIAEANGDINNLISYVAYILSDMPDFKSKSKNFPEKISQGEIAKFLQTTQATISRRIKFVEKRLGKTS